MHYRYFGILLLASSTFAQTQTQSDEKKEQVAKNQKNENDSSKTRRKTPTLVVRVKRPVTAASTRSIRSKDLKIRPISKPTDLLRVTPGLIVAQHAGGGKATQFFIRGFDIDHGTDLALSTDGMPINMVSHGHGQGYADIHFLIPEVYNEVVVHKGPYFVEDGDFATAGSVQFLSKKNLKENFLSVTGGMFNTYRVLWDIK